MQCKKEPDSCPDFGYEYTYFQKGISYTPELDSFQLGDELLVTGSVPKMFFDSIYSRNVRVDNNLLKGSFIITKTSGDATIPSIGAASDVTITPIIGRIYKDSISYTPFQLENLRSVEWQSLGDSLQLVFKVKPLVKGTFIVGLNQQSLRDTKCALFKYLVRISNSNQHLYFISNISGGYISEYNRNFNYCFKVY